MPDDENEGQERRGMTAEQVRAMVSSIITAGNAQTKLETLFQDNFELRGKNQKLTSDLEAANAKVPKDGSLVLTGDDVTLFNEAKATGKTAAQLKELVADHGKLSDKVVELERKTTIAEIAEEEGWKPNVLDRLTVNMVLGGLQEFEEEVDDPDNPGQKKKEKFKRGVIRVTDSGGKESVKRLVEELDEFLPSLQKDAGAAKESTGTRDQGVPLPRQARGDKVATEAGKDVSQSLINKRYRTAQKKD